MPRHPMRLKRVPRASNPVMLVCKRCEATGAKRVMHREVECYADTLADPGAFYCQDCAEVLAPAQTDSQLVIAQHPK